MIDFKKLYMDNLSEMVTIDGKKRPRVRHAQQYNNIEVTPKKHQIDIWRNEGKDVYMWSDQHFGHQNIIRYADRPFVEKEEMTEQLIINHNNIVGEHDICIWGGDIAFMGNVPANEILSRCNGYKILVVGNHDLRRKKLKNLDVDEIHLVYAISNNTVDCVVSHFPLHNLPWPYVNIHGHTHNNEEQSVQHINICVEHTQYKPVTLLSIMEEAEHRAFIMAEDITESE